MHHLELKKRQILDRVDVLDVIQEHVALKRSGRRWVGLCPFHAEKTPSFTVRPEHGSFKCFGCGKGGDVFSFVQFRENVTFMEAMGILAERAGVDLEVVPRGESAGPTRADLARVNQWASRFFRSRLLDPTLGRSVREYLKTRQVTDATSEAFCLGLAVESAPRLQEAAARAGVDASLLLAADLVRTSEDGRRYETFRNRLIFPIRDASSRVIGFGGRTLSDDRAKYLNTCQNALFDKGRCLYGIDLARDTITRNRRAVVVEGYTDCLAAHQAGFTQAVATLGTAMTEGHVDQLRRYCDEIVLMFDSDQAGEAAADRAMQVALSRCVTVRLARLPSGKDPSEFLCHAAAEEFSDLLNCAVDALEFKWLQTQQRFGGEGSDAQRREGVVEFLRVVAQAVDTHAVDAIQRGLLMNQVAHLLRMDRTEVDQLVSRLRTKRSRGAAPVGSVTSERRASAPSDSVQSAWIRLLEVSLNEPGLCGDGDSLPGIDLITNGRDRRIGAVVSELAHQVGEFTLAEVLSRFSEAEDVARVLELADRGEKRGNYANTFHTALSRIRRAMQDDKVEQSRRSYFDAREEGEALQEADAKFASFGEALREQPGPGFVARRLRRQAVTSAKVVGATDVNGTVEQP